MMYIIRNKETKLFPTEYSGEKEFPFTTGNNLYESLAGYYYFANNKEYTEKILEKEFPNEKDKYEIVEFKFPKSFYIREPVENRHFNIIDGYGKVFFNTNLENESIQDNEGRFLFDQNTGEVLKIPAYRQYFILELVHGSAQINYYERTDEGHDYGHLYIELVLDEQGFPYWEITNETGGSDCDGPIEYHNFYMSYGDYADKEVCKVNYTQSYSDEYYEQDLKYSSPWSINTNKRSCKRDYRAEEAGY